MASPGVQSDDGSFNRQFVEDIEQRIVDRAREELGENVDLSQGSPIKQLLDVVILEHEHFWKLMEDVYYAAYYGHSYEEQLDKILELVQISRIPRRGATGEVTFSVDVSNTHDVVIPEGTIITTRETENKPEIPFRTTKPARLAAGASFVANVPVRAREPWETDLDERWLGRETNVAADTITRIETSIPGVDRVTNPNPTGATSRQHGYAYIEGRDRERDHELRKRFEESLGASGAASMDAIRASVLQLTNVKSADIEENVEMEEDTETGLPPKSFRVTALVDEEDDDNIAQAIYDTRSAGILSYGDESGVAISETGESVFQSFQYSEAIPVYVEVDLKHDDNYPHDGNLRVEQAVVEYIGGTDANDNYHLGLGMGQDVIYDILFKRIMNISGVWRVDLTIGDEEEMLLPQDVEIGRFENAETTAGDTHIFAAEEERP